MNKKFTHIYNLFNIFIIIMVHTKTKKNKKIYNRVYPRIPKNKMTNINKLPLEKCSTKPITGFYRDGYCRTGIDDLGTHTVCARMDKRFMEYTKKKGNNLYSVVQPGENWCLCQYRWKQSYQDGYAPSVINGATNNKTNSKIIENIYTISS